ncbi:DUF6901 family protein [Candidatus Manganitrophus noduliformans]|uniref:Uncharacterized protein n=1 Tax=Candidatus Manganitrophus noduliformans TaxID=2606439 RepID=A0A7X6DPE6_9BACT|nr:hypothetical protein [Candidatus Manganitrophus noduliformans]NKE70948.1 hypothetical protein [Candidatus Manganitrophus noduliformans]
MVTYRYAFAFADGTMKTFDIALDPESLAMQNPAPTYPGWARLDYAPCENCPLDRTRTDYCPVAVNIAGLVDSFKNVISYQEADIVVTTEDRIVFKRTAAQNGLYSILGIYMVTSGCPVLDRLRPMVRFHLPFASIDETVFRSAGMYLLAQYFRKKKGFSAEFAFEGLSKIYREINGVNIGLLRRLQTASNEDANLNALANLDVFAFTLHESTEDSVGALESLFHVYLKE